MSLESLKRLSRYLYNTPPSQIGGAMFPELHEDWTNEMGRKVVKCPVSLLPDLLDDESLTRLIELSEEAAR